MIERIFHPVGQGAFYSERHEDFTIVYDCGTEWKNRANTVIDKTIKQSFNQGEIIDILFISHFDFDHVSKINILKEHTKIKKVIMPFLYENEKILLSKIYSVLDFHILTLINNPKDFFDSDTKIITVNPVTDDKDATETANLVYDIDNLDISSIESGTILKKSFNSYEWAFPKFKSEVQFLS